MASISTTWLYQDRGFKGTVFALSHGAGNPCFNFKTSFVRSFPVRVGLSLSPRRAHLLPCMKCEKSDESSKDVSVDESAKDASVDEPSKDVSGDESPKEVAKEVTIERAPYYSYLDSTSGQLEPASGARASIPGQDYWPEGTASRVRAANAPEPTGKSVGSPSFGRSPGSRRRKNKTSVEVHDSSEPSVQSSELVTMALEPEVVEDTMEDSKDSSSDYVVYQTEPEKEEETGYELDKKLGRPHPFIDPETKKPLEEPLTSDELWWNWRKPDKEQWSRWQRRRPDLETVFLKAMAETGQVKLYGEQPTLTETSLYRARRHLFKEERLQAEQEKLDKIGPLAYYSEWVKAWKRDTSREAVQKHFEETGENETTQLIDMFSHQTDREYRIMMGTDIRIKRDPLAMRMGEDQIKQIWGGDPVYPTVNYIQDPDEVIDYRGPDFHEPTPNMLSFLKEHGKIISRDELDTILSKEKTEVIETPDIDEAMAQAVDIGENDDEGEDSEAEVDEQGEKITRNWSVLKSTPQLTKPKEKPKKEGPMSLDEAVDDSENLTDFLMDFEEE
ncbi:protein PLASTID TRANSCRIPTIONALLY ACTIVE 12, chloroplastic [Argentina anserina]|uniref:protein PLASTID TRANSCRIPTIONALLY ACTIVE 12, chloroplastic n=1 Tax=Argentina anserina TaxID=57926 RepID=UPI0021763396|nr:protein PLASTID TRANSCRIPTIONALLY ACTIVE 12, chloroplastic [Potentilla anserina]